MANIDPNTTTQTQPTDTTVTGGAPAQTETKPTEQMIPKHRFDEVYSEMKTLKEQIATFEKAKADAEKAELESKEQFKTLYEQQKAQLEELQGKSSSYQTSITQYEQTMQGLIENKLATIPKEYHELIPSNLSHVEKLGWIDRAQAKGLFGTKAVTHPIGQPMNVPVTAPDVTKMSTHEMLTMAYSKK